MIKILTQPISQEQLQPLAEAIGGFFIKVVVDITKEVLAAGAEMHVDEEKLLLENGSDRNDLWGGGYDLESHEITYDSIINNRPGTNASSDILDPEVRAKFASITKKILGI